LGLVLRTPNAFPFLSPPMHLLEEAMSTLPNYDSFRVPVWEAKAYFLLAIFSCYHIQSRNLLFFGPITSFSLVEENIPTSEANDLCCQWSLESNPPSCLQLQVTWYLLSFPHLSRWGNYNQNLQKSTTNPSLMPSYLKIFSDMWHLL
jgi:hypothetical protein